MKRTGCTAALLLALSACGGGEERARTLPPQPGGSAGSAPTASAGAEDVEAGGALTQAQLDSALLTAADLPTGYSSAPVTPEDAGGPPGAGAECDQRFDDLDSVTDDAVAKAEAEFSGPGLGTLLSQTLASYADEDQVIEGVEALASVFEDCREFTTEDEQGATTTFALSGLSFPAYGDDTLAYAVTGESEDISVALNLVVVRSGQTLALLTQGGLATDVAALEQAVEATLTKLEAAG